MTCIVCPIGCSLDVKKDGENIIVTGNKCPKGEAYAKEEILAPKRIVTASCPVDGIGVTRRVPVKTATPCPKEKISALLTDIYKTKVALPVKVGDIVISGWQGTEINVVVTRTIDQV